MARILIVEDEVSIRDLIALNLDRAGYTVFQAGSAEEAQGLLEGEARDCDAAILDVMLPGMDGFSLCQWIRDRQSGMGIIILSAKGQEQDKIRGLSLGADDYMAKPFSVSELLARVAALCRRMQRIEAPAAPSVLESGDFRLDLRSHEVFRRGKVLDLTQVEYQIILNFMQTPGKAMTREQILEKVWGTGYYGDMKIVDVNIRRLRMKIEDDPSNPRQLVTVRGFGYRWD